MRITSVAQAKNTIKEGMIINAMSDYEVMVLAVNSNDIECIDVEYSEDTDEYKKVGKSYYCTFDDFVGNYIE